MEERPAQSEGFLDPLQETTETVQAIVRQSPTRVVLVILFMVVSFVVGAALSGIVEDVAATWVQNSAGEFLAARTISNGWVLVVLGLSVGLAMILGVVARMNYRGYRGLHVQLGAKDQQLADYEGQLDDLRRELNLYGEELADRTNLLEDCRQARKSLREELDEIIHSYATQRSAGDKLVERLDSALARMIEGIMGEGSADEMLDRFFYVLKRTVPQAFPRPEHIRNVCLFEPCGDYLCLSKFYTLPPPDELSDRMRFYIGDDEFKQSETGPEGKLYLRIHYDNSNVDDLKPMVVRLTNRQHDLAEHHADYIGFFGMIDLPAPFSSYVLVPVSRAYGILRIESEGLNTFGEDHFGLLRKMARRLHIALLIRRLSLEGDMEEETDYDH